jgi:hypothetical protein
MTTRPPGRGGRAIDDAPSALFTRQVITTFEEEYLAGLVHVGGRLLHTDNTFLASQRAMQETLGRLPEEDLRKITALNCARLCGFDHLTS